MKHLGKIRIADEMVLKWLDYGDAAIRGVSYDVGAGVIDLILEHTSMPETKDGDGIPIVKPMYITYQDAEGHFVVLRDKGIA